MSRRDRSSSRRLERRLRLAAARPVIWLARGLQRGALAATGLLRRVADPEVAQALTAASYRRAAHYRKRWHQETGLFDFEERALSRHFPPAPARLLVVGCGAGREVFALRQRGYDLTAADPVHELVDAGRARSAGDVRWEVADLGALADPAVLPGPFDGVIVGWGAWGHVLEPSARIAALRALAARCPSGPILVSWTYEKHPGLRGAASTTGAIRDGAPRRSDRDDWFVTPGGAFHVKLGEPEVRADARAAGYARVDYSSGADAGYPHAVLWAALAST